MNNSLGTFIFLRLRVTEDATQSLEAACDFAKAGIRMLSCHIWSSVSDITISKHDKPGALRPCPLQAVGIADEFVQHVDNLPKFRPVTSLLLPAVQHQLVEGNGAVHWWG